MTRENCVAHNGSLVPVPGRDIEVQAWYQGGISVMDFTDAAHPFEIAYFDRGPIDPKMLVLGGDWSAYWYNGHIYASEIARGLDVFELTPTKFLTQNEIDAAKTVRVTELNVQNQQKNRVAGKAGGGESVRGPVVPVTSAACRKDRGYSEGDSKRGRFTHEQRCNVETERRGDFIAKGCRHGQGPGGFETAARSGCDSGASASVVVQKKCLSKSSREAHVLP